MSEPNAQNLVLSLPSGLEPVYVNVARIGHTPMELILDFACLLPGQGENEIRSRLVMSPVGAKLFLRALAENLARYEAAFGEIHLPGDPSLANDLFGGVR
jgi:hypothetical protein